jgi:hypothetical protein
VEEDAGDVRVPDERRKRSHSSLVGTDVCGVARGLSVAQSGAGAEAEDGGEVQWVGAAGEGFNGLIVRFDGTVVPG